MAQHPVGIAEVDTLVTKAIERGVRIPDATPRWQILAWAAELLDLQRRDPAAFDRDGFLDVSRRHFPQ